MKVYTMRVKEIVTTYVEIKAASREAALESMNDYIQNNDLLLMKNIINWEIVCEEDA